jgi:hypothetical protein
VRLHLRLLCCCGAGTAISALHAVASGHGLLFCHLSSAAMFHTFQSSIGLRSPGSEDGLAGKPARTAGSRRISTSNACVECRRRKIRCDQWYQHPEACGYSKPAQRVVPSRK